jgi:hypothetical protein
MISGDQMPRLRVNCTATVGIFSSSPLPFALAAVPFLIIHDIYAHL